MCCSLLFVVRTAIFIHFNFVSMPMLIHLLGFRYRSVIHPSHVITVYVFSPAHIFYNRCEIQTIKTNYYNVWLLFLFHHDQIMRWHAGSRRVTSVVEQIQGEPRGVAVFGGVLYYANDHQETLNAMNISDRNQMFVLRRNVRNVKALAVQEFKYQDSKTILMCMEVI